MGSVLIKLLEWRNEFTLCPHSPSIRARLLTQRKCSVAITRQFAEDERDDEAMTGTAAAAAGESNTCHRLSSSPCSSLRRTQATEPMSAAHVDPAHRTASPRRRGGESNEASEEAAACSHCDVQNELRDEMSMSYGFFTMPCNAAATGYCQIHYRKAFDHGSHTRSSLQEASRSSVPSCVVENESEECEHNNNNNNINIVSEAVAALGQTCEEANEVEEECLGTLDCADAFMYRNGPDERVYQERESVVYRAPCAAQYTSAALRTRYQTTAVPQPYLNKNKNSTGVQDTARHTLSGMRTFSSSAAPGMCDEGDAFPSLIAQLQHRWRCQPDRLALGWRVVEQVVRTTPTTTTSSVQQYDTALHTAPMRCGGGGGGGQAAAGTATHRMTAAHEACEASGTRCYHMGPPQYMTAGELSAQVRRCAAALRLIGCAPGELILLLDETRWEWLVTCYAAWSIGAVVVVLHEAERCLVRALRDTQQDRVRAIVCPSSHIGRLRSHYAALQAAERTEEDTASRCKASFASQEDTAVGGCRPHTAMPFVLATRPLLEPASSAMGAAETEESVQESIMNNSNSGDGGVLDWYAMLEQGEATLDTTTTVTNGSSSNNAAEDDLVRLRATDLALIVYTEGEPRGVMLTHGALVASVKAYVERLDQMHLCPAPDLVHAATMTDAAAHAAARYAWHPRYSRNSNDDLNLLMDALPDYRSADDTEKEGNYKEGGRKTSSGERDEDDDDEGRVRVCRRRHKDGGECERGAYIRDRPSSLSPAREKRTQSSPRTRRGGHACGPPCATSTAARSRTNVHLPSYLAHMPLHHVSELVLETSCLLRGFLVCFGHAATLMETNAVRPHGDLHTFRPLFLAAVPATLDALRATVQHTLTAGYRKLFFDVAYEARRQALRRGLDTPFLNQLVFAQPRRLLGGRCRVILACGAALPPRTQEYLQVVCGASVLQLYTLPELAGCGTMQPYGSDALDNLGGPLAPTELKLRDVPPRWRHNCAQPAGELLVRSATMMVGYYRQPECGAAALEQSGWLHTGDIATRWPDGSFSRVGRLVTTLTTNVTGHVIPVVALEKIYSGHALATRDGVCVLVHPYRPYICALVLTSEARALDFLRAQAPTWWLREHIAQWPYCLRERAFNAWAAESLAALAAAQGVPAQERVRHVRVLYDEWSTWNGMRGVTGALQRERIERKYAGVIAELFADEA